MFSLVGQPVELLRLYCDATYLWGAFVVDT